MTVKSPDGESTALETIGSPSAKIPVELSTRFLEHFSEQLYSSPQKAFEELISNGWDAGANLVDVRIGPNLDASDATMAVFDNGASMDEEGLKLLWRIAFSPKKDKPKQFGRDVVGKFGIGKLATYVLAERLTYICKGSDGKIRRVTMNYAEVDSSAETGGEQLINNLQLDVFELSPAELELALNSVYGREELLRLTLAPQVLGPVDAEEDQFGAPPAAFAPPPAGTWTLVVLSRLKPVGRQLRLGVLQRMLAAALPFGADMRIQINGNQLGSSKLSVPLMQEWVIGSTLPVDEVVLSDDSAATGTQEKPDDDSGEAVRRIERLAITRGTSPVPHVILPGIGMVTGRVYLFEEKLTGGKSEDRGSSNGFHVNVLGRVVNQADPSFGEANLSHAAWARFRMTVRADGLNSLLTTDREKFREGRELRIFRAFLRASFNAARVEFDSDGNSALTDGGDALVQALGVVSLSPLRNIVSEALTGTRVTVSGMFDEEGLGDREEKRASWRDDTSTNIKNALREVSFKNVKSDHMVQFRIADSSIVVNKSHPFVLEHSRSRAEKELVRTVAMVTLLSDMYALDLGVETSTVEKLRDYRDKLFKYQAVKRRQSAQHLARLLHESQLDSSRPKRLEKAVSDALSCLGFVVEELGKPGEPEGVARAYPLPTGGERSASDGAPPAYSFTYDAKTAKSGVATTGNLNLDGVEEHRERKGADYALVVAPGFQAGALERRIQKSKTTVMRAADLGRLLELTFEYGAIPLTKLRELFGLLEHEKVERWVDALGDWLRENRPLTLDVFLRALGELEQEVPDALPAATIALVCRRNLGAKKVREIDVIDIAKGLAVLVPDLVSVDVDKVIVNASPSMLKETIERQLDSLPSRTERES